MVLIYSVDEYKDKDNIVLSLVMLYVFFLCSMYIYIPTVLLY